MDLIDIVLARGGNSGGGSGVVAITVDPETSLFNKTWREIAEAAQAGKSVVLVDNVMAPDDAQPGDYVVNTYPLYAVYRDENSGAYGVEFDSTGGAIQFYADSPDDYPLFD